MFPNYKTTNQNFLYNVNNLFRQNMNTFFNFDNILEKYKKYNINYKINNLFNKYPKKFDAISFKESFKNIKQKKIKNDDIDSMNDYDDYIELAIDNNNDNNNIKLLIFLSTTSFLFLFYARKNFYKLFSYYKYINVPK
jgi:hypothetical protein